MAKEYNADSIDYIEGLEQIRRRPDMYLGSTSGKNPPALFRMLREVIDNSLDEFLGKFCDTITIIADTINDEYTIIDNGRGIPTEINKKSGKSALTLVFTQIHAGGKFSNDSTESNYKISSGKNGVGCKGTNALSEYLTVWSNNNPDKKWKCQRFKKGVIVSEVIEEKLPSDIKKHVKKNGTVVRFKPDKTIFKDTIKMDIRRLKKELHDIQYLCPKLTINLIIDDNEPEVYYSEKGLLEIVHSEHSNAEPFFFSNDQMDVALNFTKEDGNTFKSFVNICHTDMGGTHLNGLKKAICTTVKEYSKEKILNDDILEGVIGAIHYRMTEPQYQGQTKNELTSAEPEKIVIDTLYPQLKKYFRKNKDLIDGIIKYAEKMLEQKNKMKASKDLLKGLSKLNNARTKISDKFLDADRRKYKNPQDLEMFIVEGDSAGGHFARAREGFQAELKLRGKIINAAKASAEDLFGKPGKKGEVKDGNKEIKDLVAALGCGIQDNYDETKLNFGKVILLCFSGDTKVKMLDGTELSFEELVKYEQEHPNSDYWVYSVDEHGNFVPGKAKHPRITGYTKQLIELTLDNGSSFKCTPDHLIMLRDGSYKEAQYLTTEDSLMPLYTEREEGWFNKDREKIFNNNTGKWEFTHQAVSKYFNGKTPKFYHVHHADKNYLNNSPENLKIISVEEHKNIHKEDSAQNITKYNKSAEHRQRISDLWKNTDTYKHCTFNENGWNGSEKQKETIRRLHAEGVYDVTSYFKIYNTLPEVRAKHKQVMIDLNKDDDLNLIRKKQRFLNIGINLYLNNYNITETSFMNKKSIQEIVGVCPTVNMINSLFKSFDNYIIEIKNKIKNSTEEELSNILNMYNKDKVKKTLEIRKNENVKTKKNSMAMIGKLLFDKKLEFNSENYMKLRKEKNSRAPKYESYSRYFESETEFKEYSLNYNHKIISKKIINYDEEIPVYDLTVEKYHNFVLGGNSQVVVHNCDADSDGGHISALLCAFFVNYMPELIKNGHVYIIDAPLFVANSAKNKVFGATRAEVDKKMKDLKCSDYTVTRMKGWGEIGHEELSEICLSPKTRKLIQIQWSDKIEKMCEDTMGEGVAFRKQMLGINE